MNWLKTLSVSAVAVVAGLSVTLLIPSSIFAQNGAAKAVDKAALERTRDQVKMLDDLYKTAVVGINETYVEKQFDTPAAAVAAKVFEAMKKKGYHNARLVDVTGKPKNPENIAKTAFEKAAVKEIVAGKATYEEIGEIEGKPVLRVATLVPAVTKSCASCHGVKIGDKLGTIVYELPIK